MAKPKAKGYDTRDETQRQRDDTLEATMRNERTWWEPHWRELDEYIRPGRLRLQSTDTNRGHKLHSKIINNTATIAHRVARSGLHSGMTSPARPWKMIKTPDPDLNEYGPVKEWCYTVTDRMRSLFLISNSYNSLPTLYGDELQFGTGAMGVFEDDDDFMRTWTYAPGTYWLATGARGVVDTFLREVPLTVRQVIERYSEPGKAGTPGFWEPFSSTIKTMADRGDLEQRVDVMQIIAPNAKWDREHYEARFKRFRSCHYEKGGDHSTYLRESGYDEFPIMAPRWDVTGEDVYGRGPGMDALGDTKALQTYERRSATAFEKMINPPLQGPALFANRKVSLLPGDLTAADVREGLQGLKPIHEVRAPLDEADRRILRHEERISRAFYADLFLMITQMDGIQPRNEAEIAERKEEKLLMLGPVLERQNDELFDPFIDRVFSMMLRRNLIPPPPQEMQGMPLRVEYTSVLAQAQKLIGTLGLERVSGYVGNIVAVKPEAGDNFDEDEAIRAYADYYGTAPKIIRSREAVEAIRQRRAQAQQQQAATEQAAIVAQGAQTLSETDLSTPNALTALMGAA